MTDGLGDWLRSVKERLGDLYDEAREVRGRLWGWLCNAPVVVSVPGGSAVALLGWLYLVGYFSAPQTWIRGTGVFLQLVGFILAAYGLERTLEKFGQVPSTSRILPWLEELLNIFRTRENEEIVLHGKPAKMSIEAGTGELRYDNLSLSERVERLEEQIEELEESRIDEEVERLETKIEEDVEAVEEEVEQMREKVKEVNVGEVALWLEWCGVSLFVYGVPLASFPSLFLPAYRVLAVPVLAGGLLGSLHWFAD